MQQSTEALVVTRHGGPEVLEVQSVPAPTPGPGRLLVRVAATGVNFVDVYRREGVYPTSPPFVACEEGAGVVVEAGPWTTLGQGDRVAWADAPGSAAGLVAIPAESAVPVPDDVNLEVAAGLMLQGLTAHYLVTSTFPVMAGDTALVHAAAGGVGQLLVQLVKARGGRVIATAGGEGKLAIARALGADVTIDYRATTDLAAEVRAATEGRGVDVVYDGVGAATFEASLASLRIRGTLVLYGASSGQVPPFDLQRLNRGGSLYVTRPTLAHHIATRDELLWRARELFKAVADGSLRPAIGERYELADAARAYADLESRRTTGKLLLIPSDLPA